MGSYLKKYLDVRKKENPKVELYGVYGEKHVPTNVKVNRKGSNLTSKDPITITYSKKDRTVHFTSKEFDYY